MTAVGAAVAICYCYYYLHAVGTVVAAGTIVTATFASMGLATEGTASVIAIVTSAFMIVVAAAV